MSAQASPIKWYYPEAQESTGNPVLIKAASELWLVANSWKNTLCFSKYNLLL